MPRKKPPPKLSALADLIRSARAKAGLSQGELAEKTGISRASIGTAESTKYGPRGLRGPTFRVAHCRRLALVLRLHPSDVLAAFDASRARYTLPNLSPEHAYAARVLEIGWADLTHADLREIGEIAEFRHAIKKEGWKP